MQVHGCMGRNRDSDLASMCAVNAATGQVLTTRRRRTTVWQLVTLIASSKRLSLLMAGDNDEMFMTKSLKATPKTTEHNNLIVRIDKSLAYVTNNNRLRSTCC